MCVLSLFICISWTEPSSSSHSEPAASPLTNPFVGHGFVSPLCTFALALLAAGPCCASLCSSPAAPRTRPVRPRSSRSRTPQGQGKAQGQGQGATPLTPQCLGGPGPQRPALGRAPTTQGRLALGAGARASMGQRGPRSWRSSSWSTGGCCCCCRITGTCGFRYVFFLDLRMVEKLWLSMFIHDWSL